MGWGNITPIGDSFNPCYDGFVFLTVYLDTGVSDGTGTGSNGGSGGGGGAGGSGIVILRYQFQ